MKQDTDSKVRKLAETWYAHVVWIIPTKAYITMLIGGAVFAFIFNDNNKITSSIWLGVIIFCAAKIYGRRVEIDAYVEGWQQSHDYVVGSSTIEELSESFGKKKTINPRIK